MHHIVLTALSWYTPSDCDLKQIQVWCNRRVPGGGAACGNDGVRKQGWSRVALVDAISHHRRFKSLPGRGGLDAWLSKKPVFNFKQLLALTVTARAAVDSAGITEGKATYMDLCKALVEYVIGTKVCW